MTMDPRLISSAGLLLDIAGAVLVIRGLIRLRDVNMSNASVPAQSLAAASARTSTGSCVRAARTHAGADRF